jgi:hypothetical protein
MSAPASRSMPRWKFQSAAVILACGLASLLIIAAARGDLWLDEILSIRLSQLARRPWDVFLSPPLIHDNNHALNTLYLYCVPAGSPFWAYRLLAVASGIGSLALLARVALRQWGQVEAVATVSLAGTSYPLILYLSEARGYAPAIFFGLLAFDQLSLNLEEFRWRRVFGFWVASILGVLSQSTFVILSGAFLILQLAGAIRARRKSSFQLKPFFWQQIAPVLFIGLWWLAFVSRMAIAGGPIYDKREVVQQAAALLIGMPDVAPFQELSLGIVLAVVASGAWSLWRERNIHWVFYPSVLVLVPAAMILITQPQFFYFRYLLVSFPFFYLLTAYLICRLFRQASLPFRGLLIAAMALMIIGQAARIVPLLTLGRGHYLQALQEIAEADTEPVVRVGSDHDFRNGLLVDFYAPLVSDGKKIEYIAQSRLSEFPPGWIIAHNQDMNFTPEPRLAIPGVGNYRLVREWPYGGVSGWSWSVYRRETGADSSGQIKAP